MKHVAKSGSVSFTLRRVWESRKIFCQQLSRHIEFLHKLFLSTPESHLLLLQSWICHPHQQYWPLIFRLQTAQQLWDYRSVIQSKKWTDWRQNPTHMLHSRVFWLSTAGAIWYHIEITIFLHCLDSWDRIKSSHSSILLQIFCALNSYLDCKVQLHIEKAIISPKVVHFLAILSELPPLELFLNCFKSDQASSYS